jgi:hypothetical protein
MQLTWITSVGAGALHTARAILAGRRTIDRFLAAELAAPTAALAAAIAASGCPPANLWGQLLPLAAQGAAGQILAAKALAQAEIVASPAVIQRLGRAASEFEAAFIAARPRIADELPLRCEPLRSQWEARGPGLLSGVRLLTGSDLLVPSASVVLLSPALGGDGEAYPADNLVTFEAVLANPIAQLPEVLRLGWLLAQLNPDLALLRHRSDASDCRRVIRAALMVMVLAAAEDVELASADRAHFDLAAQAWLQDPAATEKLWRWWESYSSERPAWPDALEALARGLA